MDYGICSMEYGSKERALNYGNYRGSQLLQVFQSHSVVFLIII